MEIKVNESNEIIAYAVIGGVSGFSISDEIIPEDFREKFDPKYYLYHDGQITVNKNYKPAVDE
ncbi:DUF2977 domain-containing protein [Staphylococcus pseudoxylosus]|uniref:DUF2977 domain-containing protein n=1 Tax=Staphylococcus pseudoxylosus TaxID=2282419 RepID=UPI002DBE3F69|nr:DUF2977 domain-containing protein [Staphylococcus pseudoxylosus]MEB7753280.1 DUF2977 domain-containing protein [Staphylococcus pseudoxylosus]